MCMEDLKIGRTAGSSIRYVQGAANAIVAFAPPDPTRISMTVSGVTSGTLWIFPTGFTDIFNRGIQINQTAPVLTLTVEDYGQLLFQEWSFAGAAVITAVTVVTTSQPARTSAELGK